MATEKQAASTAKAPEAQKQPPIVKHPTPLQHVFHVDVNDNGQFREVAIVKEWPNGSIHYIDVALIDNVDRGRLKKILMSPHADKYPLWQLLDQERLSNGKNALDYFHQMTRVKKAPGHVDNMMIGGGSLLDPSVRAESSTVVGTGFTDPGSGMMNPLDTPN